MIREILVCGLIWKYYYCFDMIADISAKYSSSTNCNPLDRTGRTKHLV